MNTAPFHPMDISHVSSIEYPLVVNNTDKAIQMVGGKPKITKVINSSDKSSNPNYHTTPENTLELKLRPDPFHHPLQSSYNSNEKILLKISVPKSKLPQDYKHKSMLEILQTSQDYKATPIAIIDKTYSFKSIADFQSCTKNNQTIDQIKSLYNANNYQQLNDQFQSLHELNELKDYQDLNYYDNSVTPNHNLPPPPIFSPIRFPYDYKYQKNPFTTVIKDDNGQVKVVSTKAKVKLYTKMIDYNVNDIPETIAPELQENLTTLQSRDLPTYSADYALLKCIEWLKTIFEVKPVWLRKHLDDIVPPNLKKSVKQALPYVTYIYQSGPWRFCNIKLGINPGADAKYWIYQSEYFRIPDLGIVLPASGHRIKPLTIDSDSDITVSQLLLFNGTSMPSTVTYQIGDLIDSDITTIIKDHQSQFGDSFLRQVPDFQDGWINKQTMEVIRRIIRYKLNRLAKDESIDQSKIYKIIETDYTDEKVEVDPELEDAQAGEADSAEGAEGAEGADITQLDEADETMNNDDMEGVIKDDHDDTAMDIDMEKNADETVEALDETTLLANISKSNSDLANKLGKLVGFIKQDDIDADIQ